MATPLIRLEGARELRSALIRLDREGAPRAFIEAGERVANPVAARVRAALPHRSGRLAGSVRVARIRTGAAMRVGSRGVPYAGPVEFGGWPRGRPFLGGGRYIFPTARAIVPGDALAQYAQALEHAIERNGWFTP